MLWDSRIFVNEEMLSHFFWTRTKDGTFTVKVDITIGTEKKKVWYPSLRRPPSDKNNSLSKLYGSTSCTDVTFLVGASRKEFVGHTCIIELRANAFCMN